LDLAVPRQQRTADSTRDRQACDKFEESLRLDPALGTLLNLAECEHSAGDLVNACRLWRAAADEARAAGGGPREQLARDRIAKYGCPP
jgi:hypothetical protein